MSRSRWPYGPEVTSLVTEEGARLMHEARVKVGTQAEFAERLGVSLRTAQRWERSHEIPITQGGDLVRVFREVLDLDFYAWRGEAVERAEREIARTDTPALSGNGTPEGLVRRSVLAQLYGKPSSNEEASALASELIEQAAILLRP